MTTTVKPGEIAIPAVLLLTGGYMAVTAGTSLPLSGAAGPGPGLMPLIVGLALSSLSLAGLLVQALRPAPVDSPVTTLDDDDGEGGDGPVTRWGAVRIAAILAAQVGFIVLFELLGFAVAVFAFLVFVIRFVGRTRWWLAVVLAAGLAGLYFLLFEVVLGIPFPTFFGLF